MSFLKEALKWLRATYRDAQVRDIHSGITEPTTRATIDITRGLFPDEPLERVFLDGPPPSLDDFEHKRSNVPTGARLKAWGKVREAERRLEVAIWAMWRTEPDTGKHKVLAEDQVGAFFYAVEAAIQVLKEEMGAIRGNTWFERWLANHPSSTMSLRAVRTIRTFAVHAGELLTRGDISISVVKGHGGTITRLWRLPELTPENLQALRRPKLRVDELDAWNKLRQHRPAGAILEDALTDLRQIVFDAEQLP